MEKTLLLFKLRGLELSSCNDEVCLSSMRVQRSSSSSSKSSSRTYLSPLFLSYFSVLFCESIKKKKKKKG